MVETVRPVSTSGRVTRPMVASDRVIRPMVETLGRVCPYIRPLVLFLRPMVVARPMVLPAQPLVICDFYQCLCPHQLPHPSILCVQINCVLLPLCLFQPRYPASVSIPTTSFLLFVNIDPVCGLFILLRVVRVAK